MLDKKKKKFNKTVTQAFIDHLGLVPVFLSVMNIMAKHFLTIFCRFFFKRDERMGKNPIFSDTPASASCVSNAALLELAHMGRSTISGTAAYTHSST